MKLDVIQSTNAPWYAEGLKFKCTQCGNCCTGGPGYVSISDEEIGRLAEHLRVSRDEIIQWYCRRIGSQYSLKEKRNPQGHYDCIFLQEERAPASRGDVVTHTKRTCAIYPVRPLQCRTWPFWDGNLASAQNWRRASQHCPGMDRGKHYSRKQVESLRDAKDWPKS